VSSLPKTLPMKQVRGRGSRVEKPRFPLFLKLFILNTLLVTLVVAGSIGLTIQRSNVIATTEVNERIRDAGELFDAFERNRLRQLELGAKSTASNVGFVAYMENALYGDSEESFELSEDEGVGVSQPASPPESGIDTTSILAQLEQERLLLDSDLLILTDDQGYLVARTDISNLTGSEEPIDFYEFQPMLRSVIDGDAEEKSGAMLLDSKLYHAAVVPLGIGAGGAVVGYLFNAFSIDDQFAGRIGGITKTGVLFLLAGETGSVRSADAPSASDVRAISEMAVLDRGQPLDAKTVEIVGSDYVMTGEPIVSEGIVLGAAVFVRSLDAELAPFREIERQLLYAGGVALILAFLFSGLIAKRLTDPIVELAGMAQKITSGDLNVRPDVNRSDECGILSRAFAQMSSALRDKAELEKLYLDMQELVVAKGGKALAMEPTLDRGTILVTELRGLPPSGDEGPAGLIELVDSLVRLQSLEVKRQDGRVIDVAGHRLVCLFPGDRGAIHAIRASRAIGEELAMRTAGGSITVGVGIASGEMIRGGVDAGDGVGMAIVGEAPALASMFAAFAPPEHLFVSLDAIGTAGSDIVDISSQQTVQPPWMTDAIEIASLPLRKLTTGMMQAQTTQSFSAADTATVRLDPNAVASRARNFVREPEPGQIFANRYQIEQVIGRGGMGVVYRAFDSQLEEPVAIKVLTAEVLSGAPEELERFKREIRLARKITHRNVLRTYDFGEAEGIYFISMEYIKGYTLSELIEQSAQLAPRIAMGITRQICRGLQAAHDEGVIHRDLKPQNVLMDHRGEVKLMDFGIARMTESDEAMTAAGIVIGTPHYMSPEQVQGKTLDPRSDIYSMGVMMYQTLTGVLPFNSASLTAVLTAHITETPKAPIELRADLGPEVNAIVLRCMAKSPEERFRNAGELLVALDRVSLAAAA